MIWNIIQVQFTLTLCYVIYKLVLERTGMLAMSRAYLLLIPTVLSVVPFIDMAESNVLTYTIVLPDVLLNNTTAIQNRSNEGVDLLTILGVIYWSGFAFVAIRFAYGALKLRQLIVGAKPHDVHDNTYWLASTQASFSFLNGIYLGKNLSAERAELVYQHELQHKQLGHQWDRVYMTMLSIIWWFDPIVWMLSSEQQKLHEYQVDRRMKNRVSISDYYTALFEQATGVQVFDMSSQFADHSMTFKRIKMMEKVISVKARLWSIGLLLPIVSLMLYLGSCDSPKTIVTEDEMDEVVALEATKSPDEMPEYDGGFAALGAKLQDVLEYPQKAKDENVEGTVFVSFIVSTDAKLVQAKVEKGVRPDLDDAALAAVGELDAWVKPGVKDGKPVNVSMVLPIKFVLPKE